MDYDRENVTLTFTALRVQRAECRLVSSGKAIYSIDCSKSGGKDKRTDQWVFVQDLGHGGGERREGRSHFGRGVA